MGQNQANFVILCSVQGPPWQSVKIKCTVIEPENEKLLKLLYAANTTTQAICFIK